MFFSGKEGWGGLQIVMVVVGRVLPDGGDGVVPCHLNQPQANLSLFGRLASGEKP